MAPPDGHTASVHKLLRKGYIDTPSPEYQEANPGWDKDANDLVSALSLQSWCDLDLPQQIHYLGDVVTETSRVFLVGPTGIGKSQLAYGMAGSFTAGEAFLHWRCDKPARVLIVDGEMSKRLVSKRAQLLAKYQKRIPPDALMIYSVQRGEEFAKRFPQLGKPAPLNTEEGREWLLRLIEFVRPNVVILDNVMSLIVGPQKEEEPWQETLPLVFGITQLGIAQIWLDHTGWTTDRQYGSSQKGWFMDAVGVLLRPPASVQTTPGETVFDLSFDPPGGKSRDRDPDHWDDFSPHRLRMTATGWTAEPLSSAAGKTSRDDRRYGKLSPDFRLVHQTIESLLAEGVSELTSPIPMMSPLAAVRRQILRDRQIRDGWHSEAEIVQLASSNGKLASNGCHGKLTQKGLDKENKALKALKAKNLISFTRDWVWLP